VAGGYNGMRLYVDDQGIDDSQSDGPRQTLIAPWMRRQIDDELLRLMRKRDGASAVQFTVIKPRR
jgi:SH3-like domain-containing protein